MWDFFLQYPNSNPAQKIIIPHQRNDFCLMRLSPTPEPCVHTLYKLLQTFDILICSRRISLLPVTNCHSKILCYSVSMLLCYSVTLLLCYPATLKNFNIHFENLPVTRYSGHGNLYFFDMLSKICLLPVTANHSRSRFSTYTLKSPCYLLLCPRSFKIFNIQFENMTLTLSKL